MSKTRSLSAVAGPIARKALGKRFAVLGGVLENWAHILGADLALRTQATALDFPRGQQHGGTLTIHAAPADALELQHDMPRILERLNGHFGYRAIDRIKLVQAPPRSPSRPKAAPARPATPTESAAIANALSAVENPHLRHHLEAMAEALLKGGTPRTSSNRPGRSR